MKQLLSFLNMEFLVKDDALKNWRMILFVSFLALLIISSGHLADRKIFQINELKEMKSQFVEKRAYLMELKMESRVTESLREKGIKPAKTPPLRLVIESKEQ
jgi:hypothetical protein